MLGPQNWLAALAMLFVLFTPYQTLVQTVIIQTTKFAWASRWTATT